MSTPAAGWYPDPSGAPGARWWDGTTWTEHTRTPEQMAGVPPQGQQYGQPYGRQYGEAYGAQQPGQQSYGQPYVPGGHPQASYGQPYGVGGVAPAPPASFLRRNSYTLATAACALLYLVLAFAVHVVVFGILPVLFAVRAFRAREPLAVLAGVLAGGVALFAVYELVLR